MLSSISFIEIFFFINNSNMFLFLLRMSNLIIIYVLTINVCISIQWRTRFRFLVSITHSLPYNSTYLIVLSLLQIYLLKFFESSFIFFPHLFEFIDIQILNACQLTYLMSHCLEFLRTCSDNMCTLHFQISLHS
jgi:hypothetical protein